MSFVHAPCDSLAAQSKGDAGRVGHPGLVMATTILASSLAFIDGSVVNVGLPAMGASLRSDAVGLQWIVNAYLLPLSALLLLGGAAGDRFGSRQLLMIGVGMFGEASLACSIAPSLGWLLAARFVQRHQRGHADAEQPRDSRAKLFWRDKGPSYRRLGRGWSDRRRVRPRSRAARLLMQAVGDSSF
jgi:Major Facilitator Superfamily